MQSIEFTFRILGSGSSRWELKSPKNSSEKKCRLTRIQGLMIFENNLVSSINRLSILILLSYTYFFRWKLGFWGSSALEGVKKVRAYFTGKGIFCLGP